MPARKKKTKARKRSGVARKKAKSSKKNARGSNTSNIRKKRTASKKSAAKRPRAKSRQRTASGNALRNLEGLTIKQIAARLSSYLAEGGYSPALIGKACAAIHAGPSVKPASLDFVVREYQVDDLTHVMSGIGFKNTGNNTFESRTCPVPVIISPPPIAVGDDVVDELQTIRTRDGMIKILFPTDCVRHCLSMYYKWGDTDALLDAVAVASRNKIDLDKVRRWSEWEWCSDRFEEFLVELKKKSELRA